MTPQSAALRWTIALTVFLNLMYWAALVISIYLLWPLIAGVGLGLLAIVVLDRLRGRP